MDIIRNIISNLYIYRNQSSKNIQNKNEITNKNDELPLPVLENKKKDSENNRKNICLISRPCRIQSSIEEKERKIDNKNNKYIIHKNYLVKPGINYILKNKEQLKEQEYLIKEAKQRKLKEEEALNLLILQKKKMNVIRSRIFDYEIKQQKKILQIISNQRSQIINKTKNKNKTRLFSVKTRNNVYNKKEENYPYKYYRKEAESAKLSMNKQPSLPIIGTIPSLGNEYSTIPEEYLEMADNNEKKVLIREQDSYEEQNLYKKNNNNTKSNETKGYRIISEEERNEKLFDLNNLKKELTKEISELPIAILTNKQKKRKEELEKKLDEIDAKINKLNGYKDIIIEI